VKVGDIVIMDYEKMIAQPKDEWGVGVIVETDDRWPDDVAVLWSRLSAVSWELKFLLEVINAN